MENGNGARVICLLHKVVEGGAEKEALVYIKEGWTKEEMGDQRQSVPVPRSRQRWGEEDKARMIRAVPKRVCLQNGVP